MPLQCKYAARNFGRSGYSNIRQLLVRDTDRYLRISHASFLQLAIFQPTSVLYSLLRYPRARFAVRLSVPLIFLMQAPNVSYFGCRFRTGWKQQPAVPVPHRSQPFMLRGNRRLLVCPLFVYIHTRCSRQLYRPECNPFECRDAFSFVTTTI